MLCRHLLNFRKRGLSALKRVSAYTSGESKILIYQLAGKSQVAGMHFIKNSKLRVATHTVSNDLSIGPDSQVC